ncbi:MAG TPA: nucleotide sugar dehydrogenase [Bacteroidales bacterium]|nr:nucleotide sugar dehydrogenase [Bacteroidales bacterium]
MDISIFGLGYVGCVTAGCLARYGHRMTGVDINEAKVKMIESGIPTIVERDINELIASGVSSGMISATVDAEEAVKKSDVSIICVGTPSGREGHLDLSGIFQTAQEIGAALKTKETFHTVLIRSTVPPGTNYKTGKIIEQVSGKTRNTDFAVVSNPEFLREGSAVSDFMNPPYTVAGSDSERGIEASRLVYSAIEAPFQVVSIGAAEMIKYVNNAFHALKITFANEVGEICKSIGIDSLELMQLFIRETHLNTSGAYLMPGFAYGGSCLPKDLLALKTLAHDSYLETPVIASIDKSNRNHIDYALNKILEKGLINVGILGLSFKPGTDDLRNSPMVTFAEQLIGKGYQIRIYDGNINASRLLGANREYISNHLPHFVSLLQNDINDVVRMSDIIVISHRDKKFRDVLFGNPEKEFFDLAGIIEGDKPANYEGLCW